MQYLTATVTRLGNRQQNQDRVAIFSREETVLMVLGDGLGGRPGGAFAAESLLTVAKAKFEQSTLPLREPAAFMQDLLQTAHNVIVDGGQKQQPPLNPGTTAVLCLVQQGYAWWTHVGDSRLYLFRNGQIIERTRDHSVVENMRAGGQLAADESSTHPLRNVITRCLGMTANPPILTHSQKTALQENDILLLCSDGFWEPLGEQHIGKSLVHSALPDALSALADEAERINTPQSDNLSAAVLKLLAD